MKIYVSGAGEQDAFALGYAQRDRVETTWLDPADFIERVTQSAQNEPNTQWIWLYRGPWSLLLTQASCPEDYRIGLDTWATWQRKAIKARLTHPNSMRTVNTDSTSATALNAHLGLQEDEESQTPPPLSDMALAMATLMETLNPELWDIFESLEMSATIVHSTPISRSTLPVPLPTILQDFACLAHAGKLYPELEARHAREAQRLTEECEQLRAEHQKFREKQDEERKHFASEKQDLTEENDLLLQQLHQVQEELEKIFLEKQELDKKYEGLIAEKTTLATNAATENKSQAEANAKLQTELKKAQEAHLDAQKTFEALRHNNDKLSAEHKNTQDELRSYHEENELLLLQLHQVQEELERYFLGNQQLRAAMDNSRTAMNQAQSLISALSKNHHDA